MLCCYAVHWSGWFAAGSAAEQEDYLPLWATFRTLPAPFRANFQTFQCFLENVSKISCKILIVQIFCKRGLTFPELSKFTMIRCRVLLRFCDSKFMSFAMCVISKAASLSLLAATREQLTTKAPACPSPPLSALVRRKMTEMRRNNVFGQIGGGWFSCLEASLWTGPLLCGMSTTFGWCQINPGPSNKAGT